MISNEIEHVVTFINNLHRPPKVVLKECIQRILDLYTQTYNASLTEAQDYLLTRNPIQVLKNINREQKKEDRKNEQISRRNRDNNNDTNISPK